MKRYEMSVERDGGGLWWVCTNVTDEGAWVAWDDVQANTIPIPDVRVEDEGSYDPRNRWSVYLNRRCMGIHTEKESADAQADYIRFALNIPQ